MLRLETAKKEQVILACTMTSEAKATLLEMDIDSNFLLSPIKDPIFPKTPIFLKTVSYCQDEGDSWRRQIKVCSLKIRYFNSLFIHLFIYIDFKTVGLKYRAHIKQRFSGKFPYHKVPDRIHYGHPIYITSKTNLKNLTTFQMKLK